MKILNIMFYLSIFILLLDYFIYEINYIDDSLYVEKDLEYNSEMIEIRNSFKDCLEKLNYIIDNNSLIVQEQRIDDILNNINTS